MDEEILVPELSVHISSSWLERALTLVPYVRTSGFIMPYPSSKLHVDMPRLLNAATFSALWSSDPTPITFIRSPGLFRVP